MQRTRPLTALFLALALGAGVLAGCGDDEGTAGEAAVAEAEEAFREGLAEELDGLTYNVFLTRQLNLNLPEDEAYYNGPPAPPGSSYYGVFLEVCNEEDGEDARPRRAATEFTVIDTQGNEFKPIPLDEDNPFAYHAEVLEPGRCIPEEGSIPDLGPTGGALLMFQLPQEATENRPLELEIESGGETLAYELDI